MYIDFGVLGNVSSGIENILDMNFNYALLNDFVEVIGMELDGSILTIECACADNRIWGNEETITTPREGEDPNNTPNEKDMQPFCYSLTE